MLPATSPGSGVCLAFYFMLYGADIPEGALKVNIKNPADGNVRVPVSQHEE